MCLFQREQDGVPRRLPVAKWTILNISAHKKNERPALTRARRSFWLILAGIKPGQFENYVLMCLRLALRAFALQGRLPWFAFFSFLPDLAITFSSLD